MPEHEQLDRRRPAEHWARIVRGVPEGTRNQSAASLAGYFLRHDVEIDIVLDLMLGWNMRNQPPLTDKEIERIVVSIGEREVVRRAR